MGHGHSDDGARPDVAAALFQAGVHPVAADELARLIREGDPGVSDAYLDGWWSTPDLQAMMDVVFHDNPAVLDGFTGMVFVRTDERLRHWLRGNSRRQARKNIACHYDLGNGFYALWHDDSRTYSSALFRTGQESLERAQEQKYAALVDSLDLQPGDHVLEIGAAGAGWPNTPRADAGCR